MTTTPAPGGQTLLYRSEDGRTRIEVRFDSDTAWPSLRQLAQDIRKPSGDAA